MGFGPWGFESLRPHQRLGPPVAAGSPALDSAVGDASLPRDLAVADSCAEKLFGTFDLRGGALPGHEHMFELRPDVADALGRKLRRLPGGVS